VVQYIVGETMAEVRLTIEMHRAVLTLFGDGEKVIDEEVWVFPSPIRKAEATETARSLFDDAYDYMNFTVHGLPDFPEST
jgi:hypothetical protein